MIFQDIQHIELGTISASLTAFYSLRLISLTFITYPNGSKTIYKNVHDAPIIVIIPLFILSIFAIFFGFVAKDIFVGIGSDFFSASLFSLPTRISLVEAEFGLPQIIKLLPAVGTIFGACLAIYLYQVQPQFTIDLTKKPNGLGQTLYRFFNGKYFVDDVYSHFIISKSLNVGYRISKDLDEGFVELTGPAGFSAALQNVSQHLKKLDTGYLPHYSLYITIAVGILTGILFFPTLGGITMELPILFVIIAGAYLSTMPNVIIENKDTTQKQ